jgi:small subunit ribosomal protein S8
MAVNDPIADMLSRIKNANQRVKDEVVVTMSKINLEIARVLKEQGYVNDYQVISLNNHQAISINMKYVDKKKAISGMRRISKPGLRIYAGKDEIKSVLGGLGISIISTSKGVLTGNEARKEGVGGEVIAYVW